MAAVIQVKRGTASSWTSANTVLAAGEIGFETDTKKMKVGDGSTAWTSLAYTVTDGDISSVVAGTGLSGGGTSGAVTLNLSTPVAATNGGTGLSTFTTGDLVYASGANTLAARSIGTTGQVLTVSGGLPTWSSPSASNHVGCMIFNSSDFTSVPNATDYTLTFNSEQWDTDGFHSTSSNTSRITIPSGKAGKYLIVGAVYVENQNVGSVIIRLKKNGNNFQIFQQAKISGQYVLAQFSTIVDAAVSDYYELIIYTDSGISTLRANYYSGYFGCQFLGA